MNNLLQLYKPYQKGLIFRLSPHEERRLSTEDVKILFHHYNVLFLRNVFDFDTKEQTGFWFIIKDSFGGFDELSPKVRNQVRKSLKNIEVRKISKLDFLSCAYDVYSMSYKRYKISDAKPMTSVEFNDYVLSCVDYDYWGAFDLKSGKLIAYSENVISDNACKYVALKAYPEYLNTHYPFYGLIYVMNEYYLHDKSFRYVTDGARSVSEHSNIQEFLKKFNFRKAYCRLKIYYVVWLFFLINIIFPFRNLVKIRKIQLLLRFEAMARNKI